ncbi:DUF1829 domain-containing protein [Halobacillus litoralis]|uniref:DUF1829 domain-containing protein n=1 Tax=Halobacillus litoralis TaxID=45668 RepID=UPI001CD3DBC8|nr:DUF1829 domain-containing protein [Halobacillus litoralis]MCA0970831.1 DUF1829 domain-containing protein [Halobacillus litoralis]
MATDLNRLKNEMQKEYVKWANQSIEWVEEKDFIEITTPFVDMHHDVISLFVSKENGSFRISDDGYIVDELEDLGVDLASSQRRKEYFTMLTKTFGVKFHSKTKELYIDFDELSEYPAMQQRLVQCLIKASDMLLSTRNQVLNFFTEDISAFFEEAEIPYENQVSYMGRSGNHVNFDFVVPKFKKQTPKLIKAVNNPTSEQYKEPLLSFIDVQTTKSDYGFYVLANDLNVNVSDKFKTSLENYNIHVLPWSEKEEWIQKLKTS